MKETGLETSLSPANGTVISAEAGAENITINCNISVAELEEEGEGGEELDGEDGAGNETSTPGQQLLTSWQLENYGNRSGLVPIATVMGNHVGAIKLHGERYDSSPFFATYQNELTFLRFLSEFNATVLSCGRGDMVLNLGRFPLVVYAPPSPLSPPTVSVVGDTWIEITWDPPERRGSPPLSHYVISVVSEVSHAHAEDEDSSLLSLQSHSSNNTRVAIPGLLPGTAHTVAMAAVTRLTTGDKVSNYSAGVAIATLPATGKKL